MPHCIALIEVGEPTLGIWCERCQSSAGFQVGTYLITSEGVSDSALGVISGCVTCELFNLGPAAP